MKKVLAWAAAVVVVLFLCDLLGFSAPIMFAFGLALGWLFFLARVFAQLTIDWSSFLTAAVCLMLLAYGVHQLGRWLLQNQAPPRNWQLRWTASILAMLVLTFVAGIAAVGLTHQSVWLATSPEPLLTRGREAPLRTQSLSNLKQIGMGMHTFADVNKLLPKGATFDKHGAALHGWHTSLLPFLEQAAVYHQIRLDLPWNHPDNARPAKRKSCRFKCPVSMTRTVIR